MPSDKQKPLYARLLYVIPATFVAATSVLAVVCLLNANAYLARPLPGFLVFLNGRVTSLLRPAVPTAMPGPLAGDVVVGLDGKQLDGGPAIAAAVARHKLGDRILVTVAPTQGSVQQLPAQLHLFRRSDIFYTFALPYGIGLLYLLVGALAYALKRTRAAALLLSVCVLASVFYLTLFDAHTTYHFARLWVIYPLLGAVSVHLFAVFPEIRRRTHRFSVLVWPYLAAVLLVAWRQWAMTDPYRDLPPSIAGGVFLALAFIADLLLLGRTLRASASEATRQKAKTVALGLVVSITMAVIWGAAYGLGPSFLTADKVMAMSSVFPILMGYAIVKGRVFDIDAVLRQTVGWAVATVVATALYLGAVYLVAAVFARSLVEPLGPSAPAAIVATLLAAVAFNPLRTWVQETADRLFYRDGRDPRRVLTAFGEELRRAGDLADLEGRLLSGLLRLAPFRGAALLVIERGGAARLTVRTTAGEVPTTSHGTAIVDGGPLAVRLQQRHGVVMARDLQDDADPDVAREAHEVCPRLAAELLLPLVVRGRMVGLLTLCARRDGDEPSVDDLRTLDAIASPAAIALENALLVSEKAASERLAAIGKVAAVIIHEIKNPLGIIKVSAGTLRRKFSDGDSGHELASYIETEVDRMSSTIGQLLQFARPQTAQLVPCDVALIVRRTAELLRPTLAESRVGLELDVLDTAPAIADGTQLERVLLNLMLNARDAMAQGGTLRVAVRPLRRSFGRKAIELTVEDDGCGMDDATRQALFQPFFSTRPGGTGLGLAIVRQILDEHRGTIEVASSPGVGTRFVVVLPA